MSRMPVEVKFYILLFFISACLGWCMEVICKLIQLHRFINSGFLIGPCCPIYGFGAVSVTLLLSRFADTPPAVFGLAILVCGTLEYLTSVIMEKLFHARWWDYSGSRFHLNGRVCAETLLPFGLLGLMMVYFIKPALFQLFSCLPGVVLSTLCIVLCSLFLIDTCISVWALVKIRRGAERVEGDSTEAITASVRTLLQKESAIVRRALHAFPDARIYNTRLLKRLREKKLARNAGGNE